MSERIHTRIWDESPDPRSPFLGQNVRLFGYDYYGDLVGRARWVEMLWLLFTGEAPTPDQSALLERLAVALANPGPRDPSVHAAMCGGVGGSPPAASLVAALAVASGDHGGAGELRRAMSAWATAGEAFDRVTDALTEQADDTGMWPGFSPLSHHTAHSVLDCLAALGRASLARRLTWLHQHEPSLSDAARCGLSLTGVAAAALTDLGMDLDQGEALFLLLRLPGTLAHAVEQSGKRHKQFPFFALNDITRSDDA
ncbi:hypothetical protein [Denitromonas sp.]|uniref:hypothetical protein n=1 Tax=Denitromonas sp. TaxID=2734609 RepID=UPI003A8B358D